MVILLSGCLSPSVKHNLIDCISSDEQHNLKDEKRTEGNPCHRPAVIPITEYFQLCRAFPTCRLNCNQITSIFGFVSKNM